MEPEKKASGAKKPYEKPAILYVEKLEARAVACAASTDASCGPGPMQS